MVKEMNVENGLYSTMLRCESLTQHEEEKRVARLARVQANRYKQMQRTYPAPVSCSPVQVERLLWKPSVHFLDNLACFRRELDPRPVGPQPLLVLKQRRLPLVGVHFTVGGGQPVYYFAPDMLRLSGQVNRFPIVSPRLLVNDYWSTLHGAAGDEANDGEASGETSAGSSDGYASGGGDRSRLTSGLTALLTDRADGVDEFSDMPLRRQNSALKKFTSEMKLPAVSCVRMMRVVKAVCKLVCKQLVYATLGLGVLGYIVVPL